MTDRSDRTGSDVPPLLVGVIMSVQRRCCCDGVTGMVVVRVEVLLPLPVLVMVTVLAVEMTAKGVVTTILLIT